MPLLIRPCCRSPLLAGLLGALSSLTESFTPQERAEGGKSVGPWGFHVVLRAGVRCCSWIGVSTQVDGDKIKSSPARKDLEVVVGGERVEMFQKPPSPGLIPV